MIETHAALHDLLATYFGIGDYDEVAGKEVPYYKSRMNEIGKLKRLMNSRHVDIASMVAAAEYAHTHHIPVPGAWKVVDLIPEARKAARESSRVSLSDRLRMASQEALAHGEPTWAMRLAGASSEEALKAWEAHRG